MNSKNAWIIIGLIIIIIICFIYVYVCQKKEISLLKKEIVDLNRISNKHLDIVILYYLWMQKKSTNNHFLRDYLDSINVHTVSIYGIGYLGKSLEEELSKTDIEIVEIIDRSSIEYKNYSVKHIDDNIAEVDLIIITPITDGDEIQTRLLDKGFKNIVSIKDLILSV